MTKNTQFWQVVAGTVTALALAGCSGGGEDCTPQAGTFCTEDITYSVNSCGDLEEILEQCDCGCDQEHLGCRGCDCTCSEVGDCCDGCHYVDGPCDDGDPLTPIDLCREGVCEGWSANVDPPALPAEPALPSDPAPTEDAKLASWMCPVNWEPVQHESLLDDDGQPFSWCRPLPIPRLKADGYTTPLEDGEQDGDRPVCDPAVDGTFPVLGNPACRALGDDCPAGTWPDVPAEVTGNRIYVQAGASGGNGTQAAPFGTLADGVTAAVDGDVVVIAAGTYNEVLTLTTDVTLWGACVQQTVLEAPGPYAGDDAGAVVVGAGADVVIHNLRIGGAQNGVRLDESNGLVRLDGVWIHQATGTGIFLSRGIAELENVLVDSTRAADATSPGRGFSATRAANVDVLRATFEANHDTGIHSSHAFTRLELENVLARNTLGRESDDTLGRGLHAETGAAVTGRRVLLTGNREAGLMAGSGSATVDLTNLVVVNTRGEDASGSWGEGLWVQEGAHVTLERALFERNHRTGIFLHFWDSRVNLTDGVVRETLSETTSRTQGHGVWALDQAQLTMTRVLVEGNRTQGIGVEGEETAALLTDVVVRDTRGVESSRTNGEGMQVLLGGSVTLTRGLFEQNRMVGLTVLNEGSVANLTDLTVRGTQSQESDRQHGIGLGIYAGGEATVHRGRIQGNRLAGVQVALSGAAVHLEDTEVLDTESFELNLEYGAGLSVQDGALATATRSVFRNNRSQGVFAFGEGTSLDLTDVTIADTRSMERQDVENRHGYGLMVDAGATVTCQRSRVQGNRTTGVFVLNGASLTLTDATVTGTVSEENSGGFGYGMFVGQGGSLTVTRANVEDNRTLGIGAAHEGTTLSLTDVTVQATRIQEVDGSRGLGMQVRVGAQCTLSRAKFDRNHSVGISILDSGTTAQLEDVTVEETLSRQAEASYYLNFGRGLDVSNGPDVSVVRGHFVGNRETSVYVWGADSRLDLEHVAIRQTQAAECADLPADDVRNCSESAAGTSLGVYGQAVLTLGSVALHEAHLVGLQIAKLGSAFGTGLEIRDNAIGVNVQETPEGYDFFEAVTAILMEDNVVNFDTQALFVPDPIDF